MSIELGIAAYSARMEEISRRSTLSWAGATGYLIFVYNAFANIVGGFPKNLLTWGVAMWILAVVVYAFMYSQWREIKRLWAEYEEIAKSLDDSKSNPLTLRKVLNGTKLSWVIDNHGLLCVTFLILPASLNCLAASISGTGQVQLLSVAVIGAVFMGTLLVTHPMPQP